MIYYLSGLTCTDENVIIKSNAQRVAAELGIAIVCPDTSPRGLDIEGEADVYSFGVGTPACCALPLALLSCSPSQTLSKLFQLISFRTSDEGSVSCLASDLQFVPSPFVTLELFYLKRRKSPRRALTNETTTGGGRLARCFVS